MYLASHRMRPAEVNVCQACDLFNDRLRQITQGQLFLLKRWHPPPKMLHGPIECVVALLCSQHLVLTWVGQFPAMAMDQKQHAAGAASWMDLRGFGLAWLCEQPPEQSMLSVCCCQAVGLRAPLDPWLHAHECQLDRYD